MKEFKLKNTIGAALLLTAFLFAGCSEKGETADTKIYTAISDTNVSIGDYLGVTALGDGYFSVMNDDFKSGLINYKGEIILPCEYGVIRKINDGVMAVRGENGWGYYNPELKKFIVECKNSELFDFYEGYGLYLDGQKYRFVLPDGSDALDKTYYEATPFSDGLARVVSEDAVGYIDKNGEFVIYSDYEYFDDFFEGFARISDEDVFGYINKEGEVVINFRASGIYPFREGLAQFIHDSKMGYIDSKGKVIIEPKFGAMPGKMAIDYYGFTCGVAPFIDSESGKYGFIDKSGDVVVKPLYSMVMYACEGIMRVREKNKLYGFVSASGDVISECIFDSATAFAGGTATVSVDGEYYFINKLGEALCDSRFADATEFSGEYAAVYVIDEGAWRIVKKTEQ